VKQRQEMICIPFVDPHYGGRTKQDVIWSRTFSSKKVPTAVCFQMYPSWSVLWLVWCRAPATTLRIIDSNSGKWVWGNATLIGFWLDVKHWCVHWTFQVALFISLKSAIMSLAKIDNRNFLLKMPVNKNYKNGWPGVGLWTFVCILDNFSQIDHITSKHHVHGTCCCPKNDVHFITSALVYNVSSWGKEDIQDVDGLIGLYLRKSIGFT
jgi:hypothetical protein